MPRSTATILAAAILAAALLAALLFRWQVVATATNSAPAFFLLDRWTGEVRMYYAGTDGLYPIPRRELQPRPPQ